jgi:hypothetical protein
MTNSTKDTGAGSSTLRPSAAESIRQRIEATGEGYWRHRDFAALPAPAVSQTLSRLARQGFLQRLGKGLYYRPRPTAFGKSRPSQSAIGQLSVARKVVFPAGISAANLLGFTTQNPVRADLATPARSFPRMIIGKEARLRTGRPETWNGLKPREAALLDFLRERGIASELSPQETVQKLLSHFGEGDTYERLAQIAPSEPPRVRAILGAIGQQLGKDDGLLASLRESLNPLSRFDFGNLSTLKHARGWQAKEQKRG